MEQFLIGGTDFGIGNINLKIYDNNRFDLEITSRQDLYNKITEDDNSEWSWTLYPPKVYFNQFDFVKIKSFEVKLDQELYDSNDQIEWALYFMEYCDLDAILRITQNHIEIQGTADILGKQYKVNISATA